MTYKDLTGRLEGGWVEAVVVIEREHKGMVYRIVRLRRHRMNSDQFVLECLAGEDALCHARWMPVAMNDDAWEWLIDTLGKSHVKQESANGDT